MHESDGGGEPDELGGVVGPRQDEGKAAKVQDLREPELMMSY